LLVVAAFVRRKNHHHALQLFAEIRKQCPDARLAFLGGTPDRDGNRRYRMDLERLVIEQGLDGAVHFLGWQAQPVLGRLLASADLLLHLSTCRLENFGLAVAEAVASGLPVLAADWGGLRDLVTDGENGFLARTWLSDRGPRVNWRSLIDRASNLLADRGAWDAISARARARAESDFDAGRHAALLRAAVLSAATWARQPEHPIERTAAGQNLYFRTVTLNACHKEISGTGDEFRLLVPLDGGRHYRLLAGPAATAERPPILSDMCCPSPVVACAPRMDGIEVTDSAWPGRIEARPETIRLFGRCDGATPLRDILAAVAGGTGADIDHLKAEAQRLVDEGVLAIDR
jgi:hypothetical protein